MAEAPSPSRTNTGVLVDMFHLYRECIVWRTVCYNEVHYQRQRAFSSSSPSSEAAAEAVGRTDGSDIRQSNCHSRVLVLVEAGKIGRPPAGDRQRRRMNVNLIVPSS